MRVASPTTHGRTPSCSGDHCHLRNPRNLRIPFHPRHPIPIREMKLKKLYSSREVAAITGLTARQLQWWDSRGIFTPSVPTHRTERGGFTERRYTPIELLELMVLADLRRRGFTMARLRRLLTVLRARFKVRLYDAIEGTGPVTLYIDGDKIYARTGAGDLFNVLEHPEQPLLVVGGDARLRELTVREPPARRRGKPATPGSPRRRKPAGSSS